MSKQRVVDYIITLDGEFHKAFSTLREARTYIKDLPVHIGMKNMPKEIRLVKKIEEIHVLNTYTPKTKVVLEAEKAFDEIELA